MTRHGRALARELDVVAGTQGGAARSVKPRPGVAQTKTRMVMPVSRTGTSSADMDVGAARGAVVDVGAARGMAIFFEVPATEEGLIGVMA
jgi:hypothetical protein